MDKEEDWGAEYNKLADLYAIKCREVRELKEKNKQIRAEVIEEIDRFMKNFPSLLCHLTVMEEWEKFKEQLKEQKGE